MNRPEKRWAVVDGVRLSFLEWGSARPHRPSLVCLHGLLATAESFAPFAALLADSNHVLALDLPGNGASRATPELDGSFASLAGLLRGFLEAVEVDEAILAGHSYGGALALQMAVGQCGCVRGLLLLCPAHPFSGVERPLVEFYLSRVGRALAYLVPKLPAAMLRFGFERMLASGKKIGVDRFASYQTNLNQPGTVPHVLRLLKTWLHDMRRLGAALEAHTVAVPVLLLWGAEDRVVPAWTAPLLVCHLPKAQLRVLEGVGHLPTEEAPAECARLFREWTTAEPSLRPDS